MATAQELINGALRAIGQLEQGEEPDADASADALVALNQMLDSWSTERLAVYCLQDQTFTWPANQASRTVGPTGDLIGTRPIAIDPSTYYIVNNISYPLALLNADQYNGIALKSITSTLPQCIWLNPTNPDATMYIYPVPSASFQLHLFSVLELTQPSTLATSLVIPPGYLRAFRFNLAVEVATEFGIEPPPQVKRNADLSKRNIKRINNPDLLMSMPYSLVGRRGNQFNIFSGLPQ
jgi:hypothetical protein